MLSQDNIAKLENIAEQRGSSFAEVVRLAVDKYNPDVSDMDETDLVGLVSARLKEAIKDTQKTRKRLDKALKSLEVRH